MSRNVRGLLLLPSLFLFLSFLAAPAAHAVQTGGSISLFPTDWGRLAKGDLVDVVVALNNTSTDTPASDFPDGVGPVPAKLSGTVKVLLALASPDCGSFVPGKLKFVPVGASGCVDKDANVVSCAAPTADAVQITLKPAGITVAPGGSVDIATVRIQVLDVDNQKPLGLKGVTDEGALHACSTSAPSVCSDCEAQGCSTLVFSPGGVVTGCPHPCPARIIFRGDAATPDFFEFHGLVQLTPPVNPPTEPFSVSLSNALVDPIFLYSVPLGGFLEQGGGVFTFDNPDARTNGGIAFVKIAQRDGMPNIYKVDIQVLDATLESKATVADMTVKFNIGGDAFESTNTWMKKPNGWFLNLPK
jgi:hypothetical protein